MICQYCEWDESEHRCCDARSDGEGGYACSRYAGHDGPHVACGTTKHELARWENKADNDLGVDYTDGRWIATTMGQFIQILVDSGNDPCVIFRVDADTEWPGDTFVRKMTVWSVPDGAVTDMMRNLEIVGSDRHAIYKVLKTLLERGLVT